MKNVLLVIVGVAVGMLIMYLLNPKDDQKMIEENKTLQTQLDELVKQNESEKSGIDINVEYANPEVPIDAGEPVDFDTAKERIDYFKEFANSKKQPYGFAFGLETMDTLIKKIKKINKDALDDGNPIVYTGIRIYVSRHKKQGDWNTILVGVTRDGRDIFSKETQIRGITADDPIYNTSVPCPDSCPE